MKSHVFRAAIALIAIAIGFANASVAYAQEIEKVEITFHTTDDDKDNNTKLQVWLLKGHDKEGDEIAGDDNLASGTVFKDWADNGPYILPIKTKFKREDLSNVTLRVKIIPKGNDCWRFHYTLRVFWKGGGNTLIEDGVSKKNGLELNQDNRIGNYRHSISAK